jgi:hypothetical protein
MKTLLASLLFVFTLLGVACVDAAPISEPQKIEMLLSSIGRLQGAVFIRNGSEYTAAQAAEHLRYKWNKAGDRVKTAEDFIVLCATKSSMSGLAYRIRFADGTTLDSAVFFEQQLKRLDAGQHSDAARPLPGQPDRSRLR